MGRIGKKINISVCFFVNVCKGDILIKSTKQVKHISSERPEGGTSAKSNVDKVNHTQSNFNKKRENVELTNKL